MKMFNVLRALILFSALAAVIAATGCTHARRAPQEPAPVARKEPKPSVAQVQRQYYDLGLKQYTGENYREAKQSFIRVVEKGPGTPLGLKAQENLRKIDRILKTVEEIESK